MGYRVFALDIVTLLLNHPERQADGKMTFKTFIFHDQTLSTC